MRVILLYLLALSAATSAAAAPLPVEVVENFDDHRIVLYLDRSSIDAIPAWRPGDGDPPMMLTDAIALTLKWIESKQLLKDAHICEVVYKPVHNIESRDRWYYLMELRQAQQPGRRFLAVLPDGAIVPANEEPSR